MLPVLLAFTFPSWAGAPGWIEIALTALGAAFYFLWQRGRPLTIRSDFYLWTGMYLVLRAMVWAAGPGYRFELHTYGVMIALGFILGIYVALRQAKREGVDPNNVLDLSFWILISSMIGSRGLYILVNLDEYLAEPVFFLKIWQGGLVFYGGVLGALIAGWTYCRRERLSFLRITDLFIPSVALGHFCGRLGCFSAGCCHGRPTGLLHYGAIFEAHGTVVAKNRLLGVPLHPTQLYESLGELLIFALLLWIRPRKRSHGQLLVAWLFAYPSWRFFTEMFRADDERGMLLRVDLFGDARPELLSTSQIVSLGLLTAGVLLFLSLRRAPFSPAPEPATENRQTL